MELGTDPALAGGGGPPGRLCIGVVVPFVINDNYPGGRVINDTLYMFDSYPVGFACDDPDTWPANGINNQVNIPNYRFGINLSVINKFIGAKVSQKCFVLTRCHGNHISALPFGQLYSKVTNAACSPVNKYPFALQRHRLVLG